MNAIAGEMRLQGNFDCGLGSVPLVAGVPQKSGLKCAGRKYCDMRIQDIFQSIRFPF